MSQTSRFIGTDEPQSPGSDRTTGSPQADPHGTGLAAPAVWTDHENIVQAIEQWSRDFGAADASAAELLCDRHPAEDTAFLVVDEDLDVTSISYGELADRSRRLATALSEMGIGQGDRVAVLMNKCVELPIALLAIWRLGAVHIPLFTAFATPAIQMRVEAGAAKLIITDADQRPKVTPLKGLTLIETGEQFDGLIAQHEPLRESARLGGDGVFVQLFTSGTTGKPKGVPVPIRAGAAFTSYMRFGLDVADDDVFWNAVDPFDGPSLSLLGSSPTDETRNQYFREQGNHPSKGRYYGGRTTFTTPPFDTDTVVTGNVTLHLSASITAEDTYFVSKLEAVIPDERVMPIEVGSLRAQLRTSRENPEPITAGTPTQYEISLGNTHWRFQAGEQLRVTISGGDFPRVMPTAPAGLVTIHHGEHTYLEISTAEG